MVTWGVYVLAAVGAEFSWASTVFARVAKPLASEASSWSRDVRPYRVGCEAYLDLGWREGGGEGEEESGVRGFGGIRAWRKPVDAGHRESFFLKVFYKFVRAFMAF